MQTQTESEVGVEDQVAFKLRTQSVLHSPSLPKYSSLVRLPQLIPLPNAWMYATDA